MNKLPLDDFCMQIFAKGLYQLTLNYDLNIAALEEAIGVKSIQAWLLEHPFDWEEAILLKWLQWLRKAIPNSPTGVLAAEFIDFSQGGFLGNLMQSAANIKEANELGAIYYTANNSFLEITIEYKKTLIQCIYKEKIGSYLQSKDLRETMLKFAMTMAFLSNNKLMGMRTPLVRIDFEMDEKFPQHPIYKKIFGLQPQFKQPVSVIEMDESCFYRAVLSQNKELFDVLNQHIQANYLIEADQFSQKVKKDILQLLKAFEEVSIDLVAQKQNMSTRTIQRKLKEEGTNFRKLHEDCRRTLATTLLSKKVLPIQEIAFLLGYNNLSTFSTAFKKWEGVTPLAYREGS